MEVNELAGWAALLGAAIVSHPALGAESVPEKQKACEATWRVRIESFLTPYSKPDRELTTVRTDCRIRANSRVCRQSIDEDPKGSSWAIIADEEPSAHWCDPTVFRSSNGTPGRPVIEGGTWVCTWIKIDDGRKVHFRLVKVLQGPWDIEFRSEFSTDGEHWTVMSQGHETKLAGAPEKVS
ncbi:MAG: hypothetical protein ABSF50_20645 [Burkholderiaceae bacterium]|jgi:hypothetical protein